MNTENLIERMSFEQVVMWAALLHVEGALRVGSWSDDEYSDREDELRVALVDMIDEKRAEQHEEGVPKLFGTDRCYLRALMRDELIEMLNDSDTQASIIELIYEKFFEGDKKDYAVKYEEYEKQVSNCCNGYYEMYRKKIERFLQEMLC